MPYCLFNVLVDGVTNTVLAIMAEPEDTVVFLQHIQEQCPIVLSLLDSKQAKLLSRSHNEAYVPKDINDEYIKDVSSSMMVQQKIEDAERALQDTLLIPRKVDKEVDVHNFQKQMDVLKLVSLGML